jgi:A/G-specific adenine glycosylase
MTYDTTKFKRTIWKYYRSHKREMFWRDHPTPYYVTVSEIMLQQTQVSRVAVKFETFIKKFPDWKSLARASISDVLNEWSGLGYNRRALYLRRIAGTITQNEAWEGDLPRTVTDLSKLPGIGPNTAGSILAFAYNQPVTFIETNIRSVYIHFFFGHSKKKISDKSILPLIKKTVDTKNSREWYYALMDYGAYLKSIAPNPSRKSAHHIKQKPFKGSNRELRSKILRLAMKSSGNHETLAKHADLRGYARADILRNVRDLKKEGFPL